jgi:RNA polymerase sigma factor (sigma-70 family)
MQSDFSLFVEQLKKNERDARESLIFVIQQVIKQWLAKTKNEITWLAKNKQIMRIEDISDNLLLNVATQLTAGFFNDYKSLRQFITSQLESALKDGFREFYDMLCEGSNQAWENLSLTLKIRSLPWFYNRKIKDNVLINDAYNDSMTLMYEKLSTGELKFTDAIALKSYYFRILEYKIMEYRRSQSSHVEFAEMADNTDLVYEPCLPIVTEETNKIIAHAIDRLDEVDKDIITSYYFYGERLNVIAARTGLSEENVRVKKHRALGFLMKILKEEGYGTLIYQR